MRIGLHAAQFHSATIAVAVASWWCDGAISSTRHECEHEGRCAYMPTALVVFPRDCWQQDHTEICLPDGT